jgi:hypothetical protein
MAAQIVWFSAMEISLGARPSGTMLTVQVSAFMLAVASKQINSSLRDGTS